MKVGIIGFGRLGECLTKYMVQDASVLVYDIDQSDVKKEAVENLGAKFVSLEEVCDCAIVIPMSPISSFESVIKKISPLLKKGTLVADVCSVKSIPVKQMKECLPDHIQILGTHPMFGPDSAKNTLFGTKIVLSKVRMNESLYQDIKTYLEGHGIKTIEVTPEEHDEHIAKSLFLTHLIGRTLIEFEASDLLIDTKGYRRLRKILETVENDSWQLFSDMYKNNPFSESVKKDFDQAFKNVLTRLDE